MNQSPLPEELLAKSELVARICQGEVLIVNKKRRNGLIVGKRFHAEFAGPGAVVGGPFDRDCQWLIPIGNFSLVTPQSYDERRSAYLIRRQWIRLVHELTQAENPLERAAAIIGQLENYFDRQVVAGLPDRALALLVGTQPQTVSRARKV